MVSFSKMYEQIHRIGELSVVLSHVLEERALCDTKVACGLFFDYAKEVKNHLDAGEVGLYQSLLIHDDTQVRNTANMFLSGSVEIRRVLKQYLKRWCYRKELRIDNHDLFMQDTKEMFELISNRLVDETEKLYPLVRDAMNEKKVAASV